MFTRSPTTWMRRALLVPAIASLTCGAEVGLARMGFALPAAATPLVTMHGALMVHGVFGTLIGLERAVALDRAWAFLGPAASGAGVLLLALGASQAAAIAFVVAAAILVLASVSVVRKQPQLFTVVLAAGAAALLAASVGMVRGVLAPMLVPSWIAFLVVTIAGERLELARIASPPANAVRALAVVLALTMVASLSSLAGLEGARFAGTMLVLLGAWLARFDIARHTVRRRGLPRFVAVALLAGYTWLALGGLSIALFGLVPGSLHYDAGIHAVFVGFVLSMVFAHAPIVLPAVARVRLPFHPAFYVPLAILHASLSMRVVGDLMQWLDLRRAGGLGHVFALAAFAIAIVASRLRSPALEESHAT